MAESQQSLCMYEMPSRLGTSICTFSWQDVTVATPSSSRRPSKILLDGVSGHVHAGELIAIMGPSGCGKTTLLSHLALRHVSTRLQSQSQINIDGLPVHRQKIMKRLRYVESDDVLTGSLTVRETLQFAAQLSLPSTASRQDHEICVAELLQMFGLRNQADSIVGTLAQKGISTGQKRRLSVAAQMAFAPQILVLDEPTSGLDSAASHCVMSYIRDIAKARNLIVVCSIHQPSTSTFELFDKTLLLSKGKTCYFGPVSDVRRYFDDIGHRMSLYTNPAEYVLELVNIEFARDSAHSEATLAEIHKQWAQTYKEGGFPHVGESDVAIGEHSFSSDSIKTKRSHLRTYLVVLHRSWIKARRDILVYGARFGMYMGLSILTGTVWLRLTADQGNIQSFATCILFGSTFMSFMAVVYVPAFIEDRQVFVKDRENGLYGSGSFMLANILIGLPYLFTIAVCTSTIVYWMVNFRPSGSGFLIYIMWTFLNLLAAESLVVFIASLFPNFIGALALSAMTNGIWMACNGFMVSPDALNPFWHYAFYYINYQAYVFRGLAFNEFAERSYSCNQQCYCQYDTSGRDQCQIQGLGVLEQQFRFYGGSQGLWVGITIGIIATLRLLGWAALELRR